MANTGQVAHDHLLFVCLRVQLCVIHCEHIPASFSDQKGVFGLFSAAAAAEESGGIRGLCKPPQPSVQKVCEAGL